ncbi:hypothetical protein SDRG_11096 [Saprolegnia diclina VS20]|uniref:Uncharacterized protein n=1 Tax=Saprolegnia diclina (strain VS20) TaxID=1156394 RepID=T0Q003_SAPDV|nr:hypothetical protein SDRG_11096 [Saprolegnia diclina VS20]EQC31169.1 hypothetical protein SDRG_11096 [Saprolegnia diclina VS20]|eukprot:XP_008615342.1 hypothetical protein SDRG_11096 [Saprolegnia diclina VS20]
MPQYPDCALVGSAKVAWTALGDLFQRGPPLLETGYVPTLRLPKIVVSSVEPRGDDLVLSLPLSDQKMQKMATRYPNATARPPVQPANASQAHADFFRAWGPKKPRQVTIVPGADIRFHDGWDTELHAHLSTDAKCIRPSNQLVLAHLVIDPRRGAPSLALATRPRDTIATLVVLLAPEDPHELHLKLERNGATHAWSEASEDPVQYAFLPVGASLVAAKSHGASPRVALVFHVTGSSALSYDDTGAIRRVDALLSKLSASSTIGVVRGIQMDLCRNCTTPEWSALPPLHKAFLHGLLRSAAYDVGLAAYSQHFGIQHFDPHPASPGAALVDMRDVKLDELVATGEGARYEYSVVLVFWPKRHLFQALGVAAFASAMRSFAPAAAHPYAVAITNAFGTEYLRTDSTAASHEALLQWLCDEDNVDGICRYLSAEALVDATCPWSLLAPWIQQQLAKYGWTPLAKAMNDLVARWCVDHAASLVASLAGVTDAPVCAPLEQDFVYECIRQLWVTLHTALLNPRVGATMQDDVLQRLLTDALHIEHYCYDQADMARWINARLPANHLLMLPTDVFSIIESFVWPTTSPVADIFGGMHSCSLLLGAMATALVHNAALNASPRVPCTWHCDDGSGTETVVAVSVSRLLSLLERNPRQKIEVAFLDDCRQSGTRFVRATLARVGNVSAKSLTNRFDLVAHVQRETSFLQQLRG